MRYYSEASEVIIFNSETRMLTYAVRCCWLKDWLPCPGVFVQKYNVDACQEEPRYTPKHAI